MESTVLASGCVCFFILLPKHREIWISTPLCIRTLKASTSYQLKVQLDLLGDAEK